MMVWRAGSSRAGLVEWLWQRLSALYIAGYACYLLVYFRLSPVRDYDAWLQWFNNGYVRLTLALFFFSVLVHAWIGMRSVYMDYLKPFWLRMLISLLTMASLLVLGLWLAPLLLRGAS